MTRVWQIFRDLEPYILQLFLGAVALGALAKDWRDYIKRIGRFWTVVQEMPKVVLDLICVFSELYNRVKTGIPPENGCGCKALHDIVASR